MNIEQNKRQKASYLDETGALVEGFSVVIGPEGLVLFDEQGAPFELWAYDQILSAKPLHQRKLAQLSHKENPGGVLSIERGEFAAGLIPYVPHLYGHSLRRRALASLIKLGLIALAVVSVVWITDFTVPQNFQQSLADLLTQAKGLISF